MLIGAIDGKMQPTIDVERTERRDGSDGGSSPNPNNPDLKANTA